MSNAERARCLAQFRDIVAVSHAMLRSDPPDLVLLSMNVLANASPETHRFTKFVGKIIRWWDAHEADPMLRLDQRSRHWAAEAAMGFWYDMIAELFPTVPSTIDQTPLQEHLD